MIHIIYMAAGNSRRFGSNKLFYELDGKPMYRHLLDRLTEIKIDIINQIRQPDHRYNSCHPLPGNIGLLRMYPRLPCSHKSGQRKGISYTIKAGIMAVQEQKKLKKSSEVTHHTAEKRNITCLQ